MANDANIIAVVRRLLLLLSYRIYKMLIKCLVLFYIENPIFVVRGVMQASYEYCSSFSFVISRMFPLLVVARHRCRN